MTEIDPRVKKTKETYDDIAHRYFGMTFNLNIMDSFRKQYLEYLFDLSCEGGKILDLGCGSGRDALRFNEIGVNCIGVDISSKLLSLAKEHVKGVDFCLANIVNLPFADNSFNGLWACGSLLHIPHAQKHATLREFKRVSKPNGLLYISVKEGDGEEYLFSEKYDRKPRHFSYYTMSELLSLVMGHDFEILRQGKRKWQTDWIYVYAKLKK